jgi:hypothetical protein
MAIQFTDEARAAIQNGIMAGDTVADLTFLGLSVRTVNRLEEHAQIIYLEDLVHCLPDDLLKITELCRHALNQVYLALSRYHWLPQAKKSYLMLINSKATLCRKCPLFGDPGKDCRPSECLINPPDVPTA